MATLALAQDNAFGQPLESQLRSCLLAHWIGEALGHESALRDTVYWVALLRYIGCTGHAHEVSSLFGDEIAIRAQTLVHDAASPAEVMRDVVAFATSGKGDAEREQIMQMIQQGAHQWAVHNFASGCEVGDMLLERMDFDAPVRDALRFTFERWNGNGFPNQARGEAIPLAMRVVHLSHDMEAIGRLSSPQRALETAHSRRDQTYDPEIADLFVAHGAAWFARLNRLDPWDAVLALEPEPRKVLQGAELDAALMVAADFIDLKSPYMAGHSRRCAQLSADAAGLLGLGEAATVALHRAALVHDVGTTAVPNSIWDKPGVLTRAEFDRVERHPMITEQMLRRSPALAVLNPVASAHHERCDGQGYHRRVRAVASELPGCVLAAADAYVGMTTDRADRPRMADTEAAAELQQEAARGRLEARAVAAVLKAAGHVDPELVASRRARNPGGLSRRELDVLCLAARGLTTQTIAERLFISPKTADHHIQHIYTKIGVSTRAAAMLWAIQHAVVQ